MSGNNDNLTNTAAPTTSNNNNNMTLLSTDTDSAYCTELSRRTVARAALHLGIEGMETAALDVLGSVLLRYMEGVGDSIASDVEGSGRSSGHVNAYDVLNVVGGCTAVAAMQVRAQGGGTMQQTPQQQQAQQSVSALSDQESQTIEHAGRGWEGLASFLFGSNWYSIRLEGEGIPKDDKEKSSSSAATPTTITNGTANLNGSGKGGGKVLPANTQTIQSPTATKPSGNAKSGKGKQLSNMTPPPGVSLGNDIAMGSSNNGSVEKNVSFALQRGGAANGTTTAMEVDDDNENNSATINIDKNNNSNTTTSSGRWNAPYLNEVPPFPLVTHTNTTIANPHCLSNTTIPFSMHDLAMEQEACRDNGGGGGTTNSSSSCSTSANKKQRRGSVSSGGGGTDWKQDIADLKLKIPKDVFATKDIIWGCMKSEEDLNKKKKKDEGSATTTSAAASGGGGGGKTDEKSSSTGGGPPQLPTVKMPSYVPNFFPPFPRTEQSISSVSSIPATAIMMDVMSRVSQKRKSAPSSGSDGQNNESAKDRNVVRHSLVELGKNAVGTSYWGSNWQNDEDDDSRKSKEKLKSNNTAGQATVTPGPSSSGRPSDNKKAGVGGSATDAQVVPLARASGSRVAKILEGSN